MNWMKLLSEQKIVLSTPTVSRVVSGGLLSVQGTPCQPRVSRLRARVRSWASCFGHVWQNPPSTLSSEVFRARWLVEAPVLLAYPPKPHWVPLTAERWLWAFCFSGGLWGFSFKVVDLVSWVSPSGQLVSAWREQWRVLLYIFFLSNVNIYLFILILLLHLHFFSAVEGS